MQFFYWFILLMAIGIAIFAIQNSSAPPLTLKFIILKFETSPIYTILGSIGIGILMIFSLWAPRGIKASMRLRESKKQIENLEKMLYGPSPFIEKRDIPKES